ncbi:hypothetical protein QTO34_001444, partial [Cnephaeus nilssonii]
MENSESAQWKRIREDREANTAQKLDHDWRARLLTFAPAPLRTRLSFSICRETQAPNCSELQFRELFLNPKEQQASPEKEVNKLEANNLSEKEFREMVIRWLKRMEDKFDNMSKNQEEMKKNQEEMKNDIAAVKNSIESIKSRLEEAEDHISELEDKMEKNTQLQQLLETKIRKHEESLRELRDNTKQNNIRIIGVPEGKETEQGIENLLEEIITENFPDIGKKKPTQIQEAHRVPSKMNPKRPTPRHIIIKLANTNDK